MNQPTHAVVRPPGEALTRCELTHLQREPIDVELARAQHAAYVAELAALGLSIVELPYLPEHPDAPFVEDAALVLAETIVAPTMGSPPRRGEQSDVLAAIGEHLPITHLESGTLDGGDVLRVEDVLYVGQSTRTSHAALRALAHAVLEYGLRVKAVEVRGALHLKTAASWLGDDRLLIDRARLNLSRVRGLECIEVPAEEPGAANILRVGSTLLLSSEFPRTAELLDGLGYDVRPTPLGEFAKAEAGPTCLSLLFAPGPAGDSA